MQLTRLALIPRSTSPPPTENFIVTPVVTWEAYEYRPMEELEVVGPGAPDQPVGGQHPANRGVETEER